jgi:hypothetical protein
LKPTRSRTDLHGLEHVLEVVVARELVPGIDQARS